MDNDFGGDFITIQDEDGNEYDLELLDTLEMDGKTYAIFTPADIDTMDVNDPDFGLIILRCGEEDGEEIYDSVDDDEELDRVYELYQSKLDEEEEEDEDKDKE